MTRRLTTDKDGDSVDKWLSKSDTSEAVRLHIPVALAFVMMSPSDHTHLASVPYSVQEDSMDHRPAGSSPA